MSPREAAYLDPMQRWLLEVSWEAFEDVGVVPETMAGSDTAVRGPSVAQEDYARTAKPKVLGALLLDRHLKE